MITIYKKLSEETVIVTTDLTGEIENYREKIANQFFKNKTYRCFTNPVTDKIAVFSCVRKSVEEMVEVVNELTSNESYDFQEYNTIQGINLN